VLVFLRPVARRHDRVRDRRRLRPHHRPDALLRLRPVLEVSGDEDPRPRRARRIPAPPAGVPDRRRRPGRPRGHPLPRLGRRPEVPLPGRLSPPPRRGFPKEPPPEAEGRAADQDSSTGRPDLADAYTPSMIFMSLWASVGSLRGASLSSRTSAKFLAERVRPM